MPQVLEEDEKTGRPTSSIYFPTPEEALETEKELSEHAKQAADFAATLK